MEANLPTTPGPYWWRAKDGDEWRAIILTHVDIEAIQEDIPEFGEAYIDGMTISGGQWAKAHSPDEGIEAWAIFSHDKIPISIALSEDEAINDTGSPQPKAWEVLQTHGYTCEPVTIYRKEKE